MPDELEVILEPEVADWLSSLEGNRFYRHGVRIELLAKEGDKLYRGYYSVLEASKPTMPRVGELRCLILYDEEINGKGSTLGITYFIGDDQRVFLLTLYRPVPPALGLERDRARSAWLNVAHREDYC